MPLQTKILKNNPLNISKVIQLLNENNLVALPTETVYGLAGNAYSDSAVKKIYDVKERPFSNPLIIHFKNIESALNSIILNERAELLAQKFWPGPLTLVAKIKNKFISRIACSKMKTVAVRVPSHNLFNKILNQLDFPLAAPSANLYGKITPTSANDVKDELNGKILAILDGGDSEIGLESTVIDISGSNTSVLRTGSIGNVKLKTLLLTNQRDNKNFPISPGMSKCHYQPHTPLRINAKVAYKGEALLAFGRLPKNFKGPKLSLSKEKCLIETAKNLYKMLRILDKQKSKSIAVQKIPSTGLGLAINERLIKASHKIKNG